MNVPLNIVPAPQSVVYRDGVFRSKGIPRITGDEVFRNLMALAGE
jgi:hypothetical protein